MAILPSMLTLSSFSSASDNLSLSLSSLSFPRPYSPRTTKLFTVRMGGGPRTYPGGVSKWQWKRMQNKKATQLLKARLMRERQIYEMRKRAELKAAVSELERPWEVVEQAAPSLFSVAADEQLKVLADRFQKPGGFDLWSEKDGPQLFQTPDCLPTSRFFPKGAVHSIKPYSRVNSDDDDEGFEDEIDGMRAQIGGGLKGGSNSGRTLGQGSGQRESGSRLSRKQGRPDRNHTRRFSDAEDDNDDNSYPSNSRVFTGANRLQNGRKNVDREGSSKQRDHNLSARFSGTDISNHESSYSSKSRVSSDANRETGYSQGKSSYSSNSRGSHGVTRRQSDQRNLDEKQTGTEGSDQFRKIENRGNMRSSGGKQRVKLPVLRRSSSSREQRNQSSQQNDGDNRARRMSSSSSEDVFDLSLQTDGTYSLGSS